MAQSLLSRTESQKLATEARLHSLRLWEDAATLEERRETPSALLLRLLAIETLFKVVCFAEGGEPDEFQHVSIEEVFWQLPAAIQRRVMVALNLPAEGSNLKAAAAQLSVLTEHYVRVRYNYFLGPVVTLYDEDGLQLHAQWPEAAPAASRPLDKVTSAKIEKLFHELKDLSLELIDNPDIWDY